MKKLIVHLPDVYHLYLDAESKSTGRSRSDIVRDAIARFAHRRPAGFAPDMDAIRVTSMVYGREEAGREEYAATGPHSIPFEVWYPLFYDAYKK